MCAPRPSLYGGMNGRGARHYQHARLGAPRPAQGDYRPHPRDTTNGEP